jgi:hypothetical protein
LSIRLNVKSKWLISGSVKGYRYSLRRFIGFGLREILIKPQRAGETFIGIDFVGQVIAAQRQVLFQLIGADGRYPRL